MNCGMANCNMAYCPPNMACCTGGAPAYQQTQAFPAFPQGSFNPAAPMQPFGFNYGLPPGIVS